MAMNKPILLDTCCKAGGATKGYQAAGFYVVGVDIEDQPNYCGDDFYKGDALAFIAAHGREFDVIHGSPPCQEYSPTRNMHDNSYPMLIAPMRDLMIATGKPYVIENVEGARKHMINPLMLCGSMFGLPLRRHRLFETNPPIYFAPASCNHLGKTAKKGEYDMGQHGFITVAGNNFNFEVARRAMDIDWMTHDELKQSFPPAYTAYVGAQLMAYVSMFTD